MNKSLEAMETHAPIRILGIESSCDETAAAVVENGYRICSSEVASQIDVHAVYGGVVPELASRRHLEAVIPVVASAMAAAGMRFADLDAVAATRGPGLAGALLVGFSFAKALAYGLNIPMVGVNHLEGHLNSVFLTHDPPEFPFAALLVSGGHTSLYHVTSHTACELLGATRDDAAGEAFDKVSKMMGTGYPGGAVIGQLAEKGDRKRIEFPRPWIDRTKFDFSFSGLKSAVARYLETRPDWKKEMPDIAAGFQEAVVDVLSEKLIRAAESSGCRRAVVVGGVAANGRLREVVREQAEKKGMKVHIPPPDLCGDNAAMIAAAGFHYFREGRRDALDADVFSRQRIG